MHVVWIVAFIAALLLLYAASLWLKVSRTIDARASDDRPAVPVAHIQSAAIGTALALGCSAFAVLIAFATRVL